MDARKWPATVALPGVVSEGTLNPDHLIPIFERVLREIDPDLVAEVKRRAYQDGYSWEPSDKIEYLDGLVTALEYKAPEGYYFGTVEGDGACFGFFEEDEELS